MTHSDKKSWYDWQWQLANRVTRIDDLARWLPGYATTAEMAAAAERSPMAITPYYLSLAREPWADDPIVRMAIPSPNELDASPELSGDFTGEEK